MGPPDWLPADSSLVTQRNDFFGAPSERSITPRAVQVEEEIGPLRLLAAAREGGTAICLQSEPLPSSVQVKIGGGVLTDEHYGVLVLVAGVKGYREGVVYLGRIDYSKKMVYLPAGIIPRLVRYSTLIVG